MTLAFGSENLMFWPRPVFASRLSTASNTRRVALLEPSRCSEREGSDDGSRDNRKKNRA